MGNGNQDQNPAGQPSRPIVWIIVGVVLIVAAWGVLRRENPAKPRPKADGPNVLLISIDMLRPDHLHCYGYERETCPTMDRLAAEGVLFENHISSTSWTLPAHAALFTGLADSVHGCQDTDKKLSEDIVTLAEEFQAAGYQTTGFYSGPYLHPAFGLAQGFDHYEDCTSYSQMMATEKKDEWAMANDVMKKSHQDVTSPILYAAVDKWLDTNAGDPFFMFVHMWDPHFDFMPPDPYDKMFDPDYEGEFDGSDFFFDRRINAKMDKRDLDHLLALYDGEIFWTDLHIQKILDKLEAVGELDNTIIAITSDHGTEFFEHGHKGHRQTLFDESIRVPLILHYPESLPQNMRVKAQTRLIDLAPTLLEMVDLQPSSDVMGISLLPLAEGETENGERIAISELYWQSTRTRFGLRTARLSEFKYFRDDVRTLNWYIDLKNDPGEQKPLLDFVNEPGKRLHELYRGQCAFLKEWTECVAAGPESSNPPASVINQLDGFGYLGTREDEPDDEPTESPTTQPTTQPAAQSQSSSSML
jgi:arylsulfatase A-like enzyme